MWDNSQDRYDGLTVFPPHLLDVLDGRDQVTSTARAHKEPIVFDEEPGHPHRLGVRDSVNHEPRGGE